jgi:hypothetical protein
VRESKDQGRLRRLLVLVSGRVKLGKVIILPAPTAQDNMSHHVHVCLCETEWSCSYDILPVPGSRVLCREWPQSICGQCFGSIFAGKDNAATILILKSMAKVISDSLCLVSKWQQRANLL